MGRAMTRRGFLAIPAWIAADRPASPAAVRVPVRIVIDQRAALRPAQVAYFWSKLWPQAVADFAAGGVRLEPTVAEGEVRRSPGSRPVFVGVDRAAVNLVVSRELPMLWDHGQGSSGISARYEGYDLCLIALDFAHPDQVPFFSVNTCVHELLHAILLDIYQKHPAGVAGQMRELRIDWYATRLWLFHDGAFVREAARRYAARLATNLRG